MLLKLRTHVHVGVATGLIAVMALPFFLTACRVPFPELREEEILSETLGSPLNLLDIETVSSFNLLTDGLYDVRLWACSENEQLRFKYAPFGDNVKFFALRTDDYVYYSVFAIELAAIDSALAPVTKRGISLGVDSPTVVSVYGDATERMETEQLEILVYERDSTELRFTFRQGILAEVSMQHF